jgi:hypothetical protein
MFDPLTHDSPTHSKTGSPVFLLQITKKHKNGFIIKSRGDTITPKSYGWTLAINYQWNSGEREREIETINDKSWVGPLTELPFLLNS